MPWPRLSPEQGPAQAAEVPARGPLCSLFRATLAESCACLRADFRVAERFPAAFERGLGEIGPLPLRAHPDLRVREQPAHLLEQDAGRCIAGLERLDPLEPREHGTRLVHPSTVAGKDAPIRDLFVPILSWRLTELR